MTKFSEKARINKEAEVTLNNILSKTNNISEQYEEINKITDLEVSKVVKRRLARMLK